MGRGLVAPGIYDRLVTRGLERLLRDLPIKGLAADRDALDPAEAPARVSRHVAGVVRRVLETGRDPQMRAEVVEAVLDLLHTYALQGAMDERLADTARPVLRAVQPSSRGQGARG